MRVLVVEDEERMAALLRRGLEEEGFAVDVAATGQDGEWYAREHDYDAVLLDLVLPDTDGFAVLEAIRSARRWAPVLLLTALDAVEDRVRGLDLGADDYLTKPFAFQELLARLRALMRRGARERPATIAVGNLTMDPASRVVRRGDITVALTGKEFALLEYFLRHPGEVLSRTDLIAHVWDFAFDSDSNVVDVYVGYLRQKIDARSASTRSKPFGAPGTGSARTLGTRMSLRLRLTLAFALSMAVVLTAFGTFLYVRLGAELMNKIDLELRTRGDAILSAVGQRRPVPVEVGSKLIDPDEAFAQVLAPSGEILDTAPGVAAAPMLPPEALRAISGPTFVTHRVQGVNDPARLLAVRTSPGGGANPVVVVVGATLGDRQEALHRLLLLLAIGGPVALLGASAAGWAVAGVALRPVERIRREAAAISESDPDRRLPVPDTGDELARLAETLNDMLVRLSEASEREHRFVDDASHELRTPLAILKVELDLALTRARSGEELEAVVRAASAETDRLVRLAQNLLVLARTRRGHVPLAPARVDLRELVVQIAESFAGRPGDEKPQVEVVVADGEVWVDPVRVRQAVQNLLDNAVRHGGEQGPSGPLSGEQGPITVTAERGDEVVRIEVTDTGPGFPPEILDRVFEPFTRGPSVRTSGEGAGLGLAIVKAVAEAHGGEARAENTETGGARVVLVFPA